MEFYLCELCGNVVTFAHDSGKKVSCCGQEMKKLTANTKDAAKEKHVPVIEQEGNKVTVKVGSVEHPMEEKHYITFIALETKKGHQIKKLHPNEKPEAEFALLDGDEVVCAYEYCNLHGLWKAEK